MSIVKVPQQTNKKDSYINGLWLEFERSSESWRTVAQVHLKKKITRKSGALEAKWKEQFSLLQTNSADITAKVPVHTAVSYLQTPGSGQVRQLSSGTKCALYRSLGRTCCISAIFCWLPSLVLLYTPNPISAPSLANCHLTSNNEFIMSGSFSIFFNLILF